MPLDDLDLEHIEDWLDDTLLDLMNKGLVEFVALENNKGFRVREEASLFS